MLDDFYELFVTDTDPVLPDTDNNEVPDGDEDFDVDDLTNYQEYVQGTYPLKSNSDSDDLNDGDEVNTYGTNPLEPDTDFDGLSDSDEIALGTNPNLPDTDGDDILDGDEFYSGNVTKELITNDPKVSAITGVSVDLDCKGNAEKCVTIENTYNIDVMSSNVVGIVGAPVNIASGVEFDTATITFYYDETLLNETLEENLIILWYDRDNKQYIPLEDTVVDTINNTVSYTTTHFSTYLVIDREVWYDCWRENIDYKNSSTFKTEYDIGFVVDVSGSMAGDRLDRAKTALNTFIDVMYPCDNACLVKFNSSGSVVKKYGASQSELKVAVNSLSASGGTSTNSGLEAALNELTPNIGVGKTPIIILICDGDVDNNSYGYTDDIDPEPYDFTVITDFGSDDYINNIESVITIPVGDYMGKGPYYSLIKQNKYISDLAYSNIKSMMNDVNACRYTYLVSDENWLKFCLYFNQKVQKYGKVDSEIHYFRLKLNRAPATLEEMINIINSSDKNDKWTLYSMTNTRYHMFGTDGEYNLKFGSSKNTGYIYEAVYNKDGILLTENNSPINMGTYNYCSDQADKVLHQKLDVKPYKEYGNTSDKSSKYPGDDEKAANEQRYKNNSQAQKHRGMVEESIK